MSQSGGASESFSYTKNYAIDGVRQLAVRSGDAGSGGASGEGWTFSSYSDSVPYSTSIPGSVASASA